MFINKSQQPRAMGIAIHTGYSGSYFTQLLEVSGFRTRTVKKAYYKVSKQLSCLDTTALCHVKIKLKMVWKRDWLSVLSEHSV